MTAEHGVLGEGLLAAEGSLHMGEERATQPGKVQPVELTSHPPPPPLTSTPPTPHPWGCWEE